MKLQLFFLVFSFGLLGSFGTPSPVVPGTKLVKKSLYVKDDAPLLTKEDEELIKKFLTELVEAGKLSSLAYGNADTYFDKILVNLRDYLSKPNYNPLLKTNLGGGINSLKLFGLNSISRTGEANLQTAVDKLTLDAHLGFGSINGEAAVNRKLWWLFYFKGTVHIDIKNIKLHVKLSIGLGGSGKPKLDSLSIDEWGHISTKITHGNWLGSIAGWFPGVVTNFLKSALPGMINNAVNDVLKEVDFKFP